MTEKKEQLLDRMVHLYGFEHPYTIKFAAICEHGYVKEKFLEWFVIYNEANPRYEVKENDKFLY